MKKQLIKEESKMITEHQEKNILEQVSKPSTRILTKKAIGSGTVVYSKNGDTFVLTNHHVISDHIEYKTFGIL
jgi:S1-C subfamily serine protease